MSKYENSVFPYSVHFTVNLLAWRSKGTNVTLCLFSVYSLRNYSRKKSFFQNYKTNVVKIDEIHEELSTSHFVTL